MFIKNMKFYEADGSNNSGGEADTKIDDTKKSEDEVPAPGEIEAKQIEDNLEAARQAILQDEDDIDTDDKTTVIDESDKKGESEETKIEDEADKTATEPTANTAGKVEVTDDYITKEAAKNFPKINEEHLKEILNGIKGEDMSPKIFKNYVNAQNKLRHPEAFIDKSESESEVKLPDPDKVDYKLTDDQQKEADGARIDFMFEDLKGKYPDLTKEILADRNKLNEFVSDLNINKPLDAADFVDDMKNAQKSVNTDIKDYVYKAQNWANIARVEMKKQLNDFVEFLTENGIKPEDIKADISEAYVVKNLMRNADGSLNPKVMAHYRNDARIPVVLPNVITEMLKNKYVPEMLKLAKTNGVKLRKETEPNPSMSSSAIKGKKSDIVEAVTSTTKIPPGTTDPKLIDKVLKEQAKAILESED